MGTKRESFACFGTHFQEQSNCTKNQLKIKQAQINPDWVSKSLFRAV